MSIPPPRRTKWRIRVVCGLLLAEACWLATTTAIAQTTAIETDAEKAERMKWWTDARFGMFLHWGPVSLKGTEIGWSRGKEVPAGEYDDLCKKFNPTEFDARQYVSIAKEAGMKYITLVAKHHDGFSMFATKLSDYNIMNTPFKRDVAKELADECNRQGVRFCVYYSIIDWHHPDYLPRGPGDRRPSKDANLDNYFRFMNGQLEELAQNYHPSVLWFDGDWDNNWTAERGREVYAMLHRLGPNLVMNNRLGTGRGKDGISPPETTVGDFHTPEQVIGHFSDNRNIYWESCVTLGRQWSWKPNDELKTVKQCIDLLVENAGRNGNFLLNIGPMPDGRIEPRQVEVLREMGRWMKQYGESIYGTRGGPFRPEKWGVSTCKGDTIYLHVLRWPDNGPLDLPGVSREVIGHRLLGGGDVQVKQTDDRVLIVVPPSSRQQLDTVIALKLDGATQRVPESKPVQKDGVSVNVVLQRQSISTDSQPEFVVRFKNTGSDYINLYDVTAYWNWQIRLTNTNPHTDRPGPWLLRMHHIAGRGDLEYRQIKPRESTDVSINLNDPPFTFDYVYDGSAKGARVPPVRHLSPGKYQLQATVRLKDPFGRRYHEWVGPVTTSPIELKVTDSGVAGRSPTKEEIAAYDAAISRVIEKLSPGGLWMNGGFPDIKLPKDAKPEDVVDAAVNQTILDSKAYRILRVRPFSPDGPSDATSGSAALVRVGKDLKVVIFFAIGDKSWWTRFYDAEVVLPATPRATQRSPQSR
jgi:alpha-L-fucosidase